MPWTVISDATLEVGKALRALTMRNLRDNITAVANGDAGAPKVQTAAIQDGAVTNAKFTDSTISFSRIIYPAAGDNLVLRYVWGPESGSSITTNNVYADWTNPATSPVRFNAINYGSVRVRFNHRGVGSVSNSFARIVVEGTVVAEWANVLSNTTVARVADINIAPGYRIVIQTRTDSGTTSTVAVSEVRVLANNFAIGVA